MIHCLDTEVADKVGVYAALIYNKIIDWCKYHKERNEFFFDGHFWMYNSRSSWVAHFSYMSDKNIQTALEKLVNSGLIIKGNYSENKFNRTNWYALADESPLTSSGQSNASTIDQQRSNTLTDSGQSIDQQRSNITNNTIQDNTNTQKRENKKNARAREREEVINEIIAENTAWVENQIKSGIEPDDIPALLDYTYDHLVNIGDEPTRQNLMRCAHFKIRDFKEYKRREAIKAIPINDRRMALWDEVCKYREEYSYTIRFNWTERMVKPSKSDPDIMIFEEQPGLNVPVELNKYKLRYEQRNQYTAL